MTAKHPATKRAAPSISFAAALHRVRSLRQQTAIMNHLYELVVTRFFAEGGPGNEPEYIVRLGREEVVVDDALLEKVLLVLSDQIDRLQAAQRELESGVVGGVPAARMPDEGTVMGEPVAVRDQVDVNPAISKTRPVRGSGVD